MPPGRDLDLMTAGSAEPYSKVSSRSGKDDRSSMATARVSMTKTTTTSSNRAPETIAAICLQILDIPTFSPRQTTCHFAVPELYRPDSSSTPLTAGAPSRPVARKRLHYLTSSKRLAHPSKAMGLDSTADIIVVHLSLPSVVPMHVGGPWLQVQSNK